MSKNATLWGKGRGRRRVSWRGRRRVSWRGRRRVSWVGLCSPGRIPDTGIRRPLPRWMRQHMRPMLAGRHCRGKPTHRRRRSAWHPMAVSPSPAAIRRHAQGHRGGRFCSPTCSLQHARKRKPDGTRLQTCKADVRQCERANLHDEVGGDGFERRDGDAGGERSALHGVVDSPQKLGRSAAAEGKERCNPLVGTG